MDVQVPEQLSEVVGAAGTKVQEVIMPFVAAVAVAIAGIIKKYTGGDIVFHIHFQGRPAGKDAGVVGCQPDAGVQVFIPAGILGLGRGNNNQSGKREQDKRNCFQNLDRV